MKKILFPLIIVIGLVLSGCSEQELKECDTYQCLEEAALKCEPAKGDYHDVYIEIKQGPNVVASSPLSTEKVKSKTCSLYLRDTGGKERTCNIPEIVMDIELQKYNDFFFNPLVSEQLCSGDPVRIGYGKSISAGQQAAKEPVPKSEENPSAEEVPSIRCEFVWPQEIIIDGKAYPCPWDRGYCYNPGVSKGETKCCNWNQVEGYSNCEELKR